MPLLGQKAINSLPTSFISFSHTAMSLSWLPSGVIVTYTCSTGTLVAATVEAPSECGQFVAIKCEVNGHFVHHPRAPAHRIGVHMGTSGNHSDHPRPTRNNSNH